ncbi:MAG: nucleotidyl transferase AbiEii/AbiGii toxin family protein [Acidimicrobiales bacterium]
MTGPAFDPQAMLAVLDRHHVKYVLVGGFAANVHGAMRPTKDIDVAPATTTQNLTRLADALRELNVGIRVDELPEGLPFDTSAAALKGMAILNLRSQFGDLDLTFSPAGFPAGYADLIGRATEHVVNGLTIHVAALDDVITSKATANRPKDQDALPELMRLARQAARDREGGSSAVP